MVPALAGLFAAVQRRADGTCQDTARGDVAEAVGGVRRIGGVIGGNHQIAGKAGFLEHGHQIEARSVLERALLAVTGDRRGHDETGKYLSLRES